MTASHPALPLAARIAQKIPENRKTASLVLDASIRAEPGQFAMLWLPGLDEKPFSIAECDPLTFTVARVGPFSETLHSLVPGDRLWYRGPFGKGFPIRKGRALLVGGGYGAAPLHFLALGLLAAREAPRGDPPESAGNGRSSDLASPLVALGARTSADLLFVKRFEALGLEIHLATEDGSAGERGMVTDAVKPILGSGRIDHLYSCGPEPMLQALSSLCRESGVEADLCFEAYMRCGIGICGVCEHGGRLACREGPVFHVSPLDPFFRQLII